MLLLRTSCKRDAYISQRPPLAGGLFLCYNTIMKFNREQLEVDVLFPTLFWFTEIEDVDNHSLIEWIYNEQKNNKGRKYSNIGGWQSEYVNVAEPPFDQFQKIILESTKSLQFKKSTQGFNITMWANINSKGNWNQIHNHNGADLCGVYYVKVPPNSGNFAIKDPRITGTPSEYIGYWDNNKWRYIVPKEGNFMMFPPYVEHMVMPNESEEDRISLSWNLQFFS